MQVVELHNPEHSKKSIEKIFDAENSNIKYDFFCGFFINLASRFFQRAIFSSADNLGALHKYAKYPITCFLRPYN